jgi:ATP-dependent RNA helicase RhlE
LLFTDLKIIKPILDALNKEGYEKPTPIQAQAIPHLLEGKDLLGTAQTGTGKRQLLPFLFCKIFIKNTKNHQIKALILTPTRELAIQIEESFKAYGRFLPLKTLVIFGGVKQGAQEQALKKGLIFW